MDVENKNHDKEGNSIFRGCGAPPMSWHGRSIFTRLPLAGGHQIIFPFFPRSKVFLLVINTLFHAGSTIKYRRPHGDQCAWNPPFSCL